MKSLTTMTKTELIAVATEMDIFVHVKDTKATLIHLIELHTTAPTFGELAEKLAGVDVDGDCGLEEIKPVVEQFITEEVNVYAVGTYVINIRNNHMFRVGAVTDSVNVYVSKYISKGHLEEMTFSIKSLMNTKVHVVLTKEEVLVKMHAAVKVKATPKYEVNATVKNGYVDLTVKDLETKEVHAAKVGSTMFPIVKTYLSSFKGNATTVTVKNINGNPSEKACFTEKAVIELCPCCGEKISAKVVSYCKRTNSKIECYPCQVKHGTVAKTKAATLAKKLAKEVTA